MIARSAVPSRSPLRARRASRLAAFAAAFLVSLWLSTSAASALDVNVRNSPYNARGDGVTNDRAAIQSAIDAVNAAGGGTVTVPGTYTYLTGNLILKTGVNLRIDANATLKQSQVLAHYANTPTRGRRIPGSTVPFITYLDQNHPLIYAGNARDVAVTGTGRIEMTYGTNDDDSIIVHTIGTHLVSGFRITDVTIANAAAYNVTIRNSDHGEIARVKTVTPNTLNSDGISLMNSSFIDVHDNDLTTRDDGIYIWASYDDPRRSAWWNSDTPRPSHDIHVWNNVVNNVWTLGSHGFLFINWTAAAPDASRVEISRVNVHDNRFTAPYPIGVLEADIYHSASPKTPSKWLRFANNTLISNNEEGNTPTRDLNTMATTDLSADSPLYNFGVSSNTEGVYNSNFDALNAFSTQFGTSFWSTEGNGTANNASVGQPGGWYGEINGFDRGYASISQGVYLATGRYTFSVSAQSSGAAIRLFAIQASPLTVLASTTFSNTTWTTRTITFDVTTAGNHRLGIDNAGAGSSSASFGRIDNAVLTKIG